MTIAATYPCSPSPSVASTSSTTSVWSVASSASSAATSTASSTTTPSARDSFAAPPTAKISLLPGPRIPAPQRTASAFLDPTRPPRPPVDVQPVPLEQRQHPRRTHRLARSAITAAATTATAAATANHTTTATSASAATAGVPAPAEPCPAPDGCDEDAVPSLKRQADRKLCFVENLVDSAAQIVGTIWKPPKYLAAQVRTADTAVLPLRTFIQETLRRSRTSYSTLQVALYYLIVIRPHLPGVDFDCSGLGPEDVSLVRAKQCGRRMFLAALILASKYLQDRNYSARAWSKISGLGTQEIMVNELTFLKAIDWRLHISEAVFQKWTDLVLKYTTPRSSSPVSPLRSSAWTDDEDRVTRWCELILRLSPDLSEGDESVPRAEASPDPESEFGPPLKSTTATATTTTTATATAPFEGPHPKLHTAPQPRHPWPCQFRAPPPPLQAMPSEQCFVPVRLHPPPPRTLKPQMQQANAFAAALHHMSAPNPVASSFPLPSLHLRHPSPGQLPGPAIGCGTPAASPPHPYGSGLTAPRVGAAMASVARSVKSSALSGCSQEAYPTAGPIRQAAANTLGGGRLERCSLNGGISRQTDRLRGDQPRGSSLATCVSAVSGAEQVRRQEAPSSTFTVIAAAHGTSGLPPPAFRRQYGTGMPPAAHAAAHAPLGNNNDLLCRADDVASPKSTEAAMALNSLRVAPPKQPFMGPFTPRLSSASLDGSLVIGRKRSCPSFYSDGQLSSGVTPKFSVLSGFGPSTPNMRCAPIASPLLGSPSLGGLGGAGGGGAGSGGGLGGGERGGKRARCAWEMEEFNNRHAGVAQGVR